MIGVTAQDPDSLTSLPSTANSIKISPWIVVNNAVYVNGNKVTYNVCVLSDIATDTGLKQVHSFLI